ncbi:hypothetical protein E5288_WYG016620 [Bos mutus]|uniref:Paraneoplastic antigen-like protein 8A C-terminal domain-containing protein n=1 Tax=Bos mutus TaxID=72004 RepID=A0A6B0S6C5_9CETA|nr:hypothetical protein [Bos mutus]
MDAEMLSQEEARAQDLAKAQAVASLASAAGRKVKKEPGRAAERGSALKMENPDGWNDVADGGDGPKPLVRKAGALTHSRRKKQKKTPKQEPVPWKKSQGSHSHSSASLKHPEADDGKNRERLEHVRNNKKPCVKQEGSALKKAPVKCAWKFPSNLPHVAASPGVASESDQDGGLEGPPKKKAMGWVSAKSPAYMRKKKVSLGPVSYVLVNSEDPRKKPEVSKKGPGSGQDAPDQKAPGVPQAHESPTSASQGPEAKPQSPLHASSGEVYLVERYIFLSQLRTYKSQLPTPGQWAPAPGVELVSFGPQPVNTLPGPSLALSLGTFSSNGTRKFSSPRLWLVILHCPRTSKCPHRARIPNC